MPLKHRTIVYSGKFDEQLRRLILDCKEADEFMRGAVEVLSRDPLQGDAIRPGSAVYRLATNPAAKWLPSMSIFYTFDDDEVLVMRIEKLDLKNE